VRCFLAVVVPDDVRRAITAIQHELRRVAAAEVRWVRPNAFHLTLRFLGTTSARQISDLERPIADAMAGYPPPWLELAGVGAFPGPKRPRVLWAGLAAGAESLAALARDVEVEVQRVGFHPDWRDFHPHVTLGRIRRPQSDPGLGQALAAGRRAVLGAWSPSELTLFESVLEAGGARYRPLRTWSFGHEGAVR